MEFDAIADALDKVTENVSLAKQIGVIVLAAAILVRAVTYIAELCRDVHRWALKFGKGDEESSEERVEKWEKYEEEHGYDEDPWADERDSWEKPSW